MKSYNNLYEKMLSKDNVELAIKNVIKGKNGKKKRKKQKFYCIRNFEKLTTEMVGYTNNFKHFNHKEIQIYDGISRKKRKIIVPTLKEQIMHHMVVNVLKPIFLKSMYYHSYGSIPNKGSFLGKNYIEKWVRNDKENTKYCLKIDIKKYFENVSCEILKSKLNRIIRDKKFYNLLCEIIDTVPKGIPLGFYTSQWFANFYLTDLDHFIKEKLGAKYYVRYMDDMVIFDKDKAKLHEIRKQIEKYLNDELSLEMKSNYQVFDIDKRDLDFMGFRFFRHKTTLRKTILCKMKRKANKLKLKSTLTVNDARAMLSYYGWIKLTNTYKIYCKHIKPFISFKKLRKIISNYDRRNKRCGNMLKTAILINQLKQNMV